MESNIPFNIGYLLPQNTNFTLFFCHILFNSMKEVKDFHEHDSRSQCVKLGQAKHHSAEDFGQVGALVSKLRERQLLENTLIVFTGDNGFLRRPFPHVMHGLPVVSSRGAVVALVQGGGRLRAVVPGRTRLRSRRLPGSSSSRIHVHGR